MEIFRSLVTAVSDEKFPLDISPRVGQFSAEKLSNLLQLFK